MKSIAVPDVEAIAVLLTIGYSVPVAPATVLADVTVPAKLVFNAEVIVMASEPPTCMAALPSAFALIPAVNLLSLWLFSS